MPAFLHGLPLHPLVVHAVVVLVPLAVLGTVTVAVWPTARRRFGWLVVAIAAVATATIPVATETGEGLQRRLPANSLIERHAELGDQLLPFAVVTLLAVTAFQGIHALQARNTTTPTVGPRIVSGALAAACIVAAAATAVQVVRIGDAGAQAAWSKTHYVRSGDRG